jgi:hypothetical protein
MLAYPAKAATSAFLREDFTSLATSQKNGIVRYGAPLPDLRQGLVLNGSDQYCTLALEPGILQGKQNTFVVEFIPEDDYDYDAFQTYFCTGGVASTVYSLEKRDNAANNILVVYLGNTLIGLIQSATYSPYWRTGQVNRFVLSGESGNTKLFFNGVQVLSIATAYTPKVPTLCYIGRSSSAYGYVKGTIKSLSFYRRLFSLADAQALESGLFALDQPTVNLDLTYPATTTTQARGTNTSYDAFLIDGDMEAVGTAAWTAALGAVLSKETGTPYQGAQVLRIAGVAGAIAYPTAGGYIVGRRYRVTGVARSDGVAVPSVIDASSGAQKWLGTTSTDWQRFDVTMVVSSVSGFGLRWISGLGSYVEFDDVKVAPSDELLDDADMEDTSAWQWLVNYGTTSKETGSPYSGTQCLRITADAVAGTRYPQAYQAILTAGKRYRVTGWVRSDGTQTPRILDTAQYLFFGTTSTDWQRIDVTFVAQGVQPVHYFVVTDPTATEYVEFDSLSYKEVLDVADNKTHTGEAFVLYGSPVYANPGYQFVAGSDYARCNFAEGLWGGAEQSFVMAFSPSFDLPGPYNVYFWDSANGKRHFVYHDNGGTAFSIFMGNTFVGTTSSVLPYWRKNGLNVLVVATKSGNTDVYFNGHQVMTADSTAWSVQDPAEITIGNAYTGSAGFQGVIYRFMSYPFKLSKLQALDLTYQLGVVS